MFHYADGFSGHPSSKEQLDSQCLSNSSSRNSLVQGQMINSSIVGTTITIVSIAGVPHTLLENAPSPRNLFKTRTPTRIPTRTKTRSRWCKSNKGKINFTTLTELPEDAPIMTGTFSIPHKLLHQLSYIKREDRAQKTERSTKDSRRSARSKLILSD